MSIVLNRSAEDAPPPVYCCIPIEWIQPWEQNDCIRKVKELGLGNMIIPQGTFHVGNSDADRAMWKKRYPHLATKIDTIPKFPGRETGMPVLLEMPLAFRVEQLELCRELGLGMFCWMLTGQGLASNDEERLIEAGQGLVLSEMFMGENTSILGGTLTLEKLKQIDSTPVSDHSQGYFTKPKEDGHRTIFDDPESLDFKAVHDWFVKRFGDHGKRLRELGNGRALTACEATTQMRVAMEAGADIPFFELVPGEPMSGVASSRGAARAYGKNLWGVHTAMGYYRAPTDLWTPERLRIAYDLFFIGGASIFSEPNIALCNWGSCSAFFSIPASPPIRQGEKEKRDFDDPICVRGREVLADHYRFTQFHRRPSTHPRVRMGYLLGYLDGWIGHKGAERMWMVDHPGFHAPDAIAMWRHFHRAFDHEPWYEPPRKYYWQNDPAKPLHHGTPPCGQVDIVPIEAPVNMLQSYGTLALLGWNTMTAENYAKLRAFVEAGGTLFLSVPHLSTRTRADRPQELINRGDVRDLCGVRITGPGANVDELTFAHQSSVAKHIFVQGAYYLEGAPLAAVELHGARVLAHARGPTAHPALLEHRVGKGVVYLLNTWDYAGQRLDALITDILRTLADAEQQPDIAVRGRDVHYAVYDGRMPSGQTFSNVYLVNHDIYGQPAHPQLLWRGGETPVRVGGTEMRIAWLIDDLLVSPMSRFVKVTDAAREGGGWRIDLETASQGRHVIQLAGAAPPRVRLDGQQLTIRSDLEGCRAIDVELSGKHRLEL